MRILLAVDDSEHSNAAIKGILERPWPAGSTIRVLFVVELYTPIPIPTGVVDNEAVTQSLLKEAQKVVDRTTTQLSVLGVQIESSVRQSDPRQEIVDEAKDWGADLVVVGSHGRTGLERWLLGSVAEHVVRHAPCSVQIARQPKP
jgi:nucleotide-binding universal stress UspA family protein